MTTHLSHKLPWASLTEIALLSTYPRPPAAPHAQRITQKQLKASHHFARCLQSALQEFAASDRTDNHEFDPTTWGIEERGHGGYLGYYYSLLGSYTTLNLILAEPSHAESFIRRNDHALSVLSGYGSGGHPEHIADHVRDAIESLWNGTLTADVAQTLRNHAALLFRCMYSIRPNNPFLVESAEALADQIIVNAIGGYDVEDE